MTYVHHDLSEGKSQLPAGLIEAYAQTEFRIHTQPAFTLYIGQHCALLQQAMARAQANTCLFITACNPFSQSLDDDDNAQRNKQLETELNRRGLSYLTGVGQHASNEWPGEASFLVLGVSPDVAKELGQTYEQNAVVWSDADAIARLWLLR
jgi:hypothetical protein